jgi:hypothetical protein
VVQVGLFAYIVVDLNVEKLFLVVGSLMLNIHVVLFVVDDNDFAFELIVLVAVVAAVVVNTFHILVEFVNTDLQHYKLKMHMLVEVKIVAQQNHQDHFVGQFVVVDFDEQLKRHVAVQQQLDEVVNSINNNGIVFLLRINNKIRLMEKVTKRKVSTHIHFDDESKNV